MPVSIPEGKVLLPCQITSLDDLIPGTWGIWSLRKKTKKNRRSEIDLTIIPGLAFDQVSTDWDTEQAIMIAFFPHQKGCC